MRNITHWIAVLTVAPFHDADGEFNIINICLYIHTCPLVQFLSVAACFYSSWLNATVSSCAREHAAHARPPGICCMCSRNLRRIFLKIFVVWIQFKFVLCITNYSFHIHFPRCCTGKRADCRQIPAVESFDQFQNICCPWKTPAVTSPIVSQSPPGLL